MLKNQEESLGRGDHGSLSGVARCPSGLACLDPGLWKGLLWTLLKGSWGTRALVVHLCYEKNRMVQ